MQSLFKVNKIDVWNDRGVIEWKIKIIVKDGFTNPSFYYIIKLAK